MGSAQKISLKTLFDIPNREGNDSYPKYRRRSPADGILTGIGRRCVNGVSINQAVQNDFVVPHNPWLLRQFKCHINVEICSSIKTSKYVLKYINKDIDQTIYNLQEVQGQHVDEIKNYLEGRYVGCVGAFMRLIHEPIHSSEPPVIKLALHVENGQRVYFNAQTAGKILENPPKTPITAFIELCQTNEFARIIWYADVPEYFVCFK